MLSAVLTKIARASHHNVQLMELIAFQSHHVPKLLFRLAAILVPMEIVDGYQHKELIMRAALYSQTVLPLQVKQRFNAKPGITLVYQMEPLVFLNLNVHPIKPNRPVKIKEQMVLAFGLPHKTQLELADFNYVQMPLLI